MNAQPPKFLVTLAVLTLALMNASTVYAVAYCALRDPVNTIYELFPTAESYRSHVRTIGKETRNAMKQTLPFDLHFNELGRHTLYVAQLDDAELGFVHARSEQGKWGLNEYVWAISPNLRILGVTIQRSRNPVLRDPFTAQRLLHPLEGKNLAELMADYTRISEQDSNANIEVLRSAIKTLFVTEHVWAKELSAISALNIAKRANPNTFTVIPIEDLFNSESKQQFIEIGMAESSILDREQVMGFRMVDTKGELLGLIFRTPFTIQDPLYPLWWVANTNGKIEYIGSSVGDTTHFSHLLGFSAKHSQYCSSAMELAASEVSLLALIH